MSPVKPVVSAAHNSIPENMEYHQFSLNSEISVRKLNGKACNQEKLEYILSDRKEAIKTSSGSMNESRHTNSHRGICIYSSSVHNMARNQSKKGSNELKRLKVSVVYL